MMPQQTEPGAPDGEPLPAKPRRRRVWPLVLGVLLGVLVVVLVQVSHILFFSNHYAVIPGEVYRSGQMSPEALANHIRTHRIKTVINLRGNNVFFDWYLRERDAVEHQGATFEDVNLWAYQPPLRPDLMRLIDLLEHARLPILVHCYTGADRTGLASVFALLLRTDAPPEKARGQLSLYYGHYRWGKAGCHDRLLDSYERWLQGEGPHSPARLRYWVAKVYDPELIEK